MIYTPDRSIIAPARCTRCGRFRIPPRNRHRYTPRWLRPYSTRNMAAGDVMLDASGNVLLTSDGNVLLSDGSGSPCRCCSAGTPCSACSGTTPATWIVSFSSITLRTTCFNQNPGDGTSAKFTTGSTFSGTFTLTQNGSSPCLWEYDAPYTTNVAKHWSNNTCTDPEVATTERIRITLSKFSGGFNIHAELYETTVGVLVVHLYDGGATTDDCAATQSGMSNGITTNSFLGEAEWNLGTGGTASATPA
jgi:hypothetical protein